MANSPPPMDRLLALAAVAQHVLQQPAASSAEQAASAAAAGDPAAPAASPAGTSLKIKIPLRQTRNKSSAPADDVQLVDSSSDVEVVEQASSPILPAPRPSSNSRKSSTTKGNKQSVPRVPSNAPSAAPPGPYGMLPHPPVYDPRFAPPYPYPPPPPHDPRFAPYPAPYHFAPRVPSAGHMQFMPPKSAPSKPAASKPAPSKSGASKPASSKSGASKPASSKSGASKPTASKPAASKSAASSTASSKTAASSTSSSKTKPAASQPTPSKPAPSKPAASKAAATPGRSMRTPSIDVDEARALEKEFFCDNDSDYDMDDLLDRFRDDSEVEEQGASPSVAPDDGQAGASDSAHDAPQDKVDDEDGNIVPLHVTCIRQVPTGRQGKMKPDPSSRGGKLDVSGGVDRMKVATAALKAFRLDDKYQPLPDSAQGGFPFQAHWHGSPGGKSGAVVIVDDEDFKDLWDDFIASGKRRLHIIFSMANMGRYAKLDTDLSADLSAPAASPASAPVASGLPGKNVPEDQAIQEAMKVLEEKWPCPTKTHTGVCVPDPKKPNTCARFNFHMVKQWADGCLKGSLKYDTPPDVLLRLAPSAKPPPTRGAAKHEDELTSREMLMAMFLGLRQQQAPAPAPAPAPPAPPPPPPDARSSSPPPGPDEDELFLALAAFSKKRKIAGGDISRAYTQLNELGYAPDSFRELNPARIQELSGFNEGTASAFQNFCVKWTDRMDAKRERRKRRRMG